MLVLGGMDHAKRLFVSGRLGPPHNLEAEETVLGACMISEEALETMMERLGPNDFFRPANGLIFEAVQSLFTANTSIDALAVADALQRAGRLERVGGKAYLGTLIGAFGTVRGADHAASIVADLSLLRRLASRTLEIHERALATPEDPAKLMDEAEQEIFALASEELAGGTRKLRDFLRLSAEMLERRASTPMLGVPSGFDDLDRLTGGFQPGSLVIVAARPSHGKSALMGDFAMAAAKSGAPVIIFSLEMSGEELAVRFISAEARVRSDSLRSGELREEDWTRLSGSFGSLAEVPIYIDDEANTTLVKMRAKCRRLKAREGLGLVIVDYLQLMEGPRATDSRQQEVADLSRGLKLLARELQVPVICAAQLNRRVEERTIKRPVLSDIRESGSVEQDADIVIFLHRPEMYQPYEREGEADLIVAKNRTGPVGDISLVFLKHYTRFAAAARP